jgi:hypothetical protein
MHEYESFVYRDVEKARTVSIVLNEPTPAHAATPSAEAMS